MRALDLFCGAGLVADGLRQAGWEVTGVDLHPMPRYQGPFLQYDALKLDQRFLRSFDFIWASPPCQFVSDVTPAEARHRHLNLIPQTRALLRASGLPYVIENVRRARPHLIDPVSLTGTMFGLGMTTSTGERFVLSRERLFEANWRIPVPVDPGPRGRPIANIFGGHLRCRSGGYRTAGGTGRTRDFIGEDKPALAHELMGMTRRVTMQELSEGVPPPFARHIGISAYAGIVEGRVQRAA